MRSKISSKQTVSGAAFGDFIRTEKLSKRGNYEFGSPGRSSMRTYIFPIVLFLFVFILIARLMNLQLFAGSYYRGLSDSNRLRTSIIHAPRGVIFDRNKVPMVFNIPGYRQFKDGKTTLLTQEQALPILAKSEKSVEIDSLRQYPYTDQLVHVLGYIGQISKEDLEKSPDYLPGDLVGKEGIEKQYESTLRGIDGKKLIEVDSAGNKIRELGTTDPIPGKDITLTVDAKFQQATFEAMKNVKKGAAIVSTPEGEILALVSKPSFDANLFTLGVHYKAATSSGYPSIGKILTDSDNQPLLNRAIGGVYPPGSTFKIITAAAGLEDKLIDKDYEIKDTGILRVGEFSFANWYFTQYGGKDGDVNVVKALKRSNDIFFYKIGELLGNKRISTMAKEFGLGIKLGVDLPGEVTGLVPTEEWKKDVMKEQWYLGDSYHYAIGQGYLLTTPLQVNAWTQAVANGGTLYQPHFMREEKSVIKNEKFLSRETVSLLHQGMNEACDPGGTAWPLFEFKVKNSELKIDNKNFFEVPKATGSAGVDPSYRHVSIACKTGTAQHGDEHTMPHAWITLFAPVEKPQIVVTVLNESAGEGSSEAGPIAKKILEAWFSR